MKLSKSMLLIGSGRLSGAVERDGKIDFFIDADGAIVKKSMTAARRGVSKGETVSFADDYTETPSYAFAYMANETEARPL